MKKIILFVVAMVAAAFAIASDQVYVIMKDGSVESYPGDKVDSITIESHKIDKNIDLKELASEIDKLKTEIKDLKSIDGHRCVDLGLPSGLKWATMNVGAKDVNDYGIPFAWGETSPTVKYISSNCKAYGKSSSSLKTSGVIDANGNLTADYDAATQNWGKNWRMPTVKEFEELLDYCTWTWTEINMVSGYIVENKSDNSKWIFLPAGGSRSEVKNEHVGSYGYYWSSSVMESGSDEAHTLYFSSSSKNNKSYSSLWLGQFVRPVLK